ncbi:bifunctional dTDP-4-dehydrorhamnose 3 5-epimerase/dTDP-4-dehydrorhamnose reductase [Tripterygium wilfordii]|uniref:Bifunctional dTDP-4-dehydrorhamnose 3 5-epimerase/dTDP-4-dehydrorhamnose reductase n=1 Tax=Tripterygium wilfordii TaxID=458696 RepID=A0A7J7CK82_TRIWF|nr:bifunctional dTDP-4-dehydrorhamnose 3 5-epimerase/dTDP-4-dehydrorhamnose reductase [Tripterygium wilfordii]
MQMMYDTIYKALVEVGLENEYEPQEFLNFFCLGNREVDGEERLNSAAVNTPQAHAQKSWRLMIYIHSKGMIVDDQYVILGSANINRCSMEDTRDTEIEMANGAASDKPLKFLIYGRTGWIGGLLGKLCDSQGIEYAYGSGRLEDRSSLEADIAGVNPSHVFNAAGVTGRPNVDWCESHKVETIRTNVVGTLTLADVCREKGLVLINYATGCIFEYDAGHPLGSGVGFKEEDTPNFTGSFYSKTKAMVEELLKNYENVCTLRVRMPISSDLSNPRNFITKITRYEKVVDIPNSMTILDELLPISIEMAKRNLTGIWNFTNPGVVSHNEILEMYRDYIDPNFTWKNFNLEEQAKVIVAPRSNNELDSSKLNQEFPEMLPIKESLIKNVFKPNQKTAKT